MTKQRPNSKSVAPPVQPARSAPPAHSESRTPAYRGGAAAPPASSSPPASPVRRSTYYEAVALYERGLEALQRHDYRAAVEQLNSVLRLYPEEKELHERVHLYLNICERQAAPQEATPVTVQERLYAATLAINGMRYDDALMHLRLVRDEDPDNDHALYMLAVAHAQRQEPAEAIAHLERAMALNPENRAIARRDPDLDPLRGNEAFRSALDNTAPPRTLDRRRPSAVRTKSGR
jgi:tetratricopeptide (TPR) repeat protein